MVALTQSLIHVLIGFFSLIIDHFEAKTNVSNIIQLKSISLDLETFENLNGLVMEESVYSGCVTKF